MNKNPHGNRRLLSTWKSRIVLALLPGLVALFAFTAILFAEPATPAIPPAEVSLPLVGTIGEAPVADAYTLLSIIDGKQTPKEGIKVLPESLPPQAGSPLGEAGNASEIKPGAPLTITLPSQLRAATVQAYVKAGDTAGALFSVPAAPGDKSQEPRWVLRRESGGALSLLVAGEQLLRTKPLLDAGKWHHVAVSFEKTSFPMSIMRLEVDGLEVGRCFPNFRLPLTGATLVIGEGVPGLVDGVDVSACVRRVYARADDMADPQARRPERRGQPWFRDPAQLLFALDFEKPQDGISQAPGLRGKALLLDGRKAATEAKFNLPPGIDMGAPGMLDFFVKPLDWDNHNVLEAEPARDPNIDRMVPLLEVVGRNAAGDEKILASWTVDRGMDTCGELPDFRPGKWTHVAIAWNGENLRPWFDGKYVFPGERRGTQYDKNALKSFKPAAIRFRSGRVATLVDEFSLYRGKLTDTELQNAARRFLPDLAASGDVTITPQRLLYHNAIRVGFSLNTADFPRAASATVRIYKSGEKSAPSGEVKLEIKDGIGTGSTIVPVSNYGDKTPYEAEVILADANGATLRDARAAVPIDEPAWYKTMQGIMTEVPPPWTPITLENGKLKTWSTAFTLGKDGLVAGLDTRGEEMLSAPMRLSGSSAEELVEFVPAPAGARQQPIFIDRGGTTAQWQSGLDSKNLAVSINATLEFDGMIKYVVTLSPKGSATLSRLTLDVPLKDALMPLHHAISLGSEGSSAGALVAGEGRIWDSASAYQGKNGALPPASGSFAATASTRWKNPLAIGSFLPMLWVGSEERGFCWFADNDRGWSPTNNAPAIELIRDKGTLTMRLNFISEPLTFDQPRTITFGIIPTPTKSRPADGRSWNRGGTPEDPAVRQVGGAFDAQMHAIMGDNYGIFPLQGWDFAQAAGAIMKGFGKTRELYMTAYWIHERLADWYKFGWEWKGTNGGRGFFCPSYVDYLASEFGEWFGRDILDAVYVDEVYPTWDARVEAGGAYLLPDGRVQPSTSIFQEREFFKRLWGLSVANHKVPIIVHHMTGTMVPPLASFASVTLDGEGNWLKKGGKDFMDLWPLERMRAMNLGAGGGCIPLWIPMLSEMGDSKSDLVWRRAATRTTIAQVLLHDIWLMFDRADSNFIYRFTGPALRLFDIAEPDLVFTGYWQTNLLASTTTADVRISTYHKQGKALLIVTNFSREPATGLVQIDWNALGLKPDEAAAVDLEERFHSTTKEKIDFTPAAPPALNNGALSVDLAPRDYRLIVLEKK